MVMAGSLTRQSADGIAALIVCHRRVTPETHTQGPETLLKKAILRIGVAAVYEPCQLYPSEKMFQDSYLPDYVFPYLRIGGRVLMLDYHNPHRITPEYLNLLAAIRRDYGAHIVLSSGMRQRVMERAAGVSILGFVDNYWVINSGTSVSAVEKMLEGLLCRSESCDNVLPHIIAARSSISVSSHSET